VKPSENQINRLFWNNMKPLISIVIPSLNKVRFISKTLDSIVRQNYSKLEVIIMDGGSTDGTLKIIEKYAAKYPDIIKYESKKDKGQWDAINKGFRKSRGKILTFINADDIYTNGAFNEIERLYRLNVDALWFAGGGNVINSIGIEITHFVSLYKNIFLFLNNRLLLLILNYLMQPSVFITKTAWKRYGPFYGTNKFVLEYDLWLKISKIRMPVVTNMYLSSFRIEPSTITKISSEALLREDKKVLARYTSNPVIIFLHSLHNLGRIAVGKIV
jgi:glycosyltransferase involved in cell wall biosynthesis